MSRRRRSLQGVMWDPDPDADRPKKGPPEDPTLRIRREIREARVVHFGRFGVRPPVEDPTCCFATACTCLECQDYKRAQGEVDAILAERNLLVQQGWTWIRGRKEREAEALPELLAIGWHALDLRAVTLTTGKPEWLTCSEPPHALARPRQLHLPLEATHA